MATIDLILDAGHGGSIVIDEGAGAVTFAVPAVACPAADLATGLATAINASALAGNYMVSLGSDFKLTIARTDGLFALDVSGAARELLGFSYAGYGYAASRQAEGRQAYSLPCLAIELSEPNPAQLHELEAVRHGRVESSTWGAGRRWTVRAAVAESAIPAAYAWLGVGRVRINPLGNTTALSVANLSGSVSGTVISASWETVSTGLVNLTLEVLEA